MSVHFLFLDTKKRVRKIDVVIIIKKEFLYFVKLTFRFHDRLTVFEVKQINEIKVKESSGMERHENGDRKLTGRGILVTVESMLSVFRRIDSGVVGVGVMEMTS